MDFPTIQKDRRADRLPSAARHQCCLPEQICVHQCSFRRRRGFHRRYAMVDKLADKLWLKTDLDSHQRRKNSPLTGRQIAQLEISDADAD